jgi:hypothetical protein
MTMSVVVAVAVVVIAALAGGRHQSNPGRPGPSPSRQQLIAQLAVLRRPQTATDLSLHERYPYRGPLTLKTTHSREPDRALIRCATVTPWGAKVFIVPLLPAKDPVLAHELGETVVLWVQGMGWSLPASAAMLAADGGSGPYLAVRLSDGRRVVRQLSLVPDGVAKVRYFYAKPSQRLQPGSVITFQGSITVNVHDNVAAVQNDRPNESLGWQVWYDADGRVIGRSPAWRRLRRVDGHYVVRN